MNTFFFLTHVIFTMYMLAMVIKGIFVPVPPPNNTLLWLIGFYAFSKNIQVKAKDEN